MIDAKREHEMALEASPWNEQAERTYAFAMGWRARAELADATPVVKCDQRARFEKAFPVPSNVEWNIELQRYQWNRANNSLSEAMVWNQRWAVWQAAVLANFGAGNGEEQEKANETV